MKHLLQTILSLWLVAALLVAPLTAFSFPTTVSPHCAMQQDHADRAAMAAPVNQKAGMEQGEPGCKNCKTDVCDEDACPDHGCSPCHIPFTGMLPFSTLFSNAASPRYLNVASSLLSRSVPPPLPPPA
ncbi:MAG: hypothetical protein J5I92_17325 [Thiogranum sp.]|nr:hypothetical protein [Thiogranum sp.]